MGMETRYHSIMVEIETAYRDEINHYIRDEFYA